MKYLNTYKLFENNTSLSNVKLDCEEILLELKDDGFEINVIVEPVVNNTTARGQKFTNRKNQEIIDYIVVNIINNNEFSLKDIQEYIDRLIDYLSVYNLKVTRNLERNRIIKNNYKYYFGICFVENSFSK